MDRILILFFSALLIAVMYIDINKKYIPNFLNFSILIISLFVRGIADVENFFIGAACYSLPILIFYGYVSDILEKEVFGFGDIKLIVSLGGILYQTELNLFLQIYLFYLLTFTLATVYIIFSYILSLLRKKKTNLKKEIAFAPYLCLSFFILYNLIFY